MNPLEFKATAQESEADPRMFIHDLASPAIYTKGGQTFSSHGNQHKVGICTAISLVQNTEQATGKSYSADFQYLLQKKYFDNNWVEGSSIFSALKAAKKYGFLPTEHFTYITESDRILSYEEYVAKLQAIPDNEVQRLLALCEPKLTGYASVDVSSRDNVAHAIESSTSGILCRYMVTDRWWLPSWDPKDIDPLKGDGNVVGGHAINMTAYDYTNGEIQLLSNTWGQLWNAQGNAHIDYSVYKMTEAFIPYYDTTPVTKPSFTRNLSFGMTGSDIKELQKILHVTPQSGYFGSLTKQAVIAFQKQNNLPQTGIVGPLTRAKLNNQAGVIPMPSKTEVISILHTFLAVFGAAVASNISTLDVNHLSKDMLIAFGVAVLRSAIKKLWNMYFPQE